MISNKCHYALKAVLELAKREGAGPATIVDIAHAQQIPARFLEAILRQLKQAGLTESVRGKRGGYVLARPARDITMGEVIRLMEGPFFDPEWLPQTNGAFPQDVFQTVWQQADEALRIVYDAANLADLAEADRQRTLQYIPDYAI
jgi:Rrf2 family transcriptional regulator, cysteine metabolism repressor